MLHQQTKHLEKHSTGAWKKGLPCDSQTIQLPKGTSCLTSRFKPDCSQELMLVASMQKNLPSLNDIFICCRYLFKAQQLFVWRTEVTSHKFTDWQYYNVMF